jgi:hypothetical protein
MKLPRTKHPNQPAAHACNLKPIPTPDLHGRDRHLCPEQSPLRPSLHPPCSLSLICIIRGSPHLLPLTRAFTQMHTRMHSAKGSARESKRATNTQSTASQGRAYGTAASTVWRGPSFPPLDLYGRDHQRRRRLSCRATFSSLAPSSLRSRGERAKLSPACVAPLSAPPRLRQSNLGGAKPTDRAAIAAERRTALPLLRTSLDSMSTELVALRLIRPLGRPFARSLV